MSISEKHQAVIDALKEKFSEQILEASEYQNTVMVRVSSVVIHDVCKELYREHNFIYLVDIFGTDRFTSDERFEVVYHMLSLHDGIRMFVKVRCEEEDPHVPTVTDIWKGANWHERLTYDMFGIRFDNHPDPRRMFLPEDFEYYPLRKEFPLLGVPGSLPLPSSTPDTED